MRPYNAALIEAFYFYLIFIYVGRKCVLRGNLDSEECSFKRFQPIVFRTEGNSDCIYTKSSCEDQGQVIHHNGSTANNRKCRCAFDCGYLFVFTPQLTSFCNPFVEDCSCFRNTSVESLNNSEGKYLIM